VVLNVCSSFSFCFLYSYMFCFCIMICFVYLLIEILNPRVEDMFYLLYLLYVPGKFSGYFAGGGWVQVFSLHTHFARIYHEWDPKTSDLKNIRNRGISDTRRDVLPTLVFVRIPTRVCSFYCLFTS